MTGKKATSPNGSTYDGDWLNDQRHGYGVWSRTDGTRYAGQWENDKPHGEGTIFFADGTVYTGQWEEGKRNGPGTLTYPDGRKVSGNWAANKLFAEQSEEQDKPDDQQDQESLPEEENSAAEIETRLFRKASLENISSPEQLNDYIRVSTPSVWLIVFAMFALLAAVFYWGFTGSMPSAVNAQGVFIDGQAVCFISPAEAENIRIGQTAGISAGGGIEEEGSIIAIRENPMSRVEVASELNNEYLVQTLVKSEFAVKVTIAADSSALAENSLLNISIITDSVRPIDFLWN